MEVKYSYLEEQFKDHAAIFADLDKLIQSGDYTLGKPVVEFEEKFAALIGTKYAIGVNSGTDALFLSLKALNVGPGDEVITSPNTFIATVGAIVAAGAKPVYVDATEEFTIDPGLIEKAITKNTKVIMPVHYAGHPADMKEIMALAEKHGLKVIEDSCQAIGASLDGKWVGSFGVTGGFSLHPLKNLNVWGDGGIIVTSSEEIRDRLVLLRNHGLLNRDEVGIYGYNSRLDSLQAVVGNHLIKDIHVITENRIKWANKLDAALRGYKGCIAIPERRTHKRYVYHLYMMKVEKRDELLAYLLKNGVDAKVHYPIPMHLQPAAAGQGYRKGDFPVTESQSASLITLPVHQHLSPEQVDYMIDVVKRFYS
jgi:dTDP-4-amino-4,6-dideoxygalactose transaminase